VTIEVESAEGGCRFRVKAHAGARREGLAGEQAGALKVDVCAAPERGKANEAILRLLAKALQIKLASLALARGETSPRKTVIVSGLSAEEVRLRLEKTLTAEGRS